MSCIIAMCSYSQYIISWGECQVEWSTQAWIRQPLALLCSEGGLSKPAAIVLALLIDQATNTDPPSPVQVRMESIAADSGYNVRTVRRAIAELLRGDLIASCRTGRGSIYELTGAIELLPAKRQPITRSSSKSKQKQASAAGLSAREMAEMADYLSCVNNFQQPTLVAADLGVCGTAAQEDDPDYLL